MAKVKTQFVCNECGGTAAKLMGKCPHCGQWNTMQEEVIDNGKTVEGKNRYQGFAKSSNKVEDLDEVSASDYIRKTTHRTFIAKLQRNYFRGEKQNSGRKIKNGL